MDAISRGQELLLLTELINRKIEEKKLVELQLYSINVEIGFMEQRVKDLADPLCKPNIIINRLILKSKSI